MGWFWAWLDRVRADLYLGYGGMRIPEGYDMQALYREGLSSHEAAVRIAAEREATTWTPK